MEQRIKKVVVLSVKKENISQFDNLRLMMELEQVIKKSIRKSDSFVMTEVNQFEIAVPSCTEEIATKIGERVIKNFNKCHTEATEGTVSFMTKDLAFSA